MISTLKVLTALTLIISLTLSINLQGSNIPKPVYRNPVVKVQARPLPVLIKHGDHAHKAILIDHLSDTDMPQLKLNFEKHFTKIHKRFKRKGCTRGDKNCGMKKDTQSYS